MKRSLGQLLLGVLLLVAAPAPRAADSYRVDAVYLDKGQIVLDDRVFRLNASTRVYRAGGTAGAPTELRKGMRVDVRAQHNAPQPLVTHIRILQ